MSLKQCKFKVSALTDASKDEEVGPTQTKRKFSQDLKTEAAYFVSGSTVTF